MTEQTRTENTRTLTEGEAARLLNEAIDRQNQIEWATKLILEAERGDE